MTKAIVESVRINNGLLVHFNVFDETGHVGTFRYTEPDESKYKQYEPGSAYTLDLTFVEPEALAPIPTPVIETPVPVIDSTPTPVEEPSLMDKVKDFFTPSAVTTTDTIPSVSDTVSTPVLDAPTFEQKAAQAFPDTTTDSTPTV